MNYTKIKKIAECAFNSATQIEGSGGFEEWWKNELFMNRELWDCKSTEERLSILLKDCYPNINSLEGKIVSLWQAYKALVNKLNTW